jgi:hypothetical protein
MLYDTRWDKKIEEPSLPGMIAWLEQQPASKRYNYYDFSKCACGQYYESLGMVFTMHTPIGWWLNEKVARSGNAGGLTRLFGRLFAVDTMGEALNRARLAMPEWKNFQTNHIRWKIEELTHA